MTHFNRYWRVLLRRRRFDRVLWRGHLASSQTDDETSVVAKAAGEGELAQSLVCSQ